MAVLAVFMAVTALGVILARAMFGHFPISGFIPHVAIFSAWLCIVACGIARRRQ